MRIENEIPKKPVSPEDEKMMIECSPVPSSMHTTRAWASAPPPAPASTDSPPPSILLHVVCVLMQCRPQSQIVESLTSLGDCYSVFLAFSHLWVPMRGPSRRQSRRRSGGLLIVAGAASGYLLDRLGRGKSAVPFHAGWGCFL